MSTRRLKNVLRIEYTPFGKGEAISRALCLRIVCLNKSVGADCLPPNLLKVCAREIASPLSFIINKSLETSTVPNDWKIAKICPIFKSGKTELVENYRP